MLVSLKWLSQYVDIENIAAEELAERITRSGIEVDAIIDRSEGMTNVVVGHVVSKEKHPEADKLNVCQVDVGEEELQQIVCGAPNVDAGQKVIVARPGAKLPGGIKIKKAKLRGQESNGMICSLQELGIEGRLVPKAYAEGIYVLPADTTPGADALEVLGQAWELKQIAKIEKTSHKKEIEKIANDFLTNPTSIRINKNQLIKYCASR